MFQALPAFLQEKHYQDVADNNDTAHHKAWHSDIPAFQWLSQHAEIFDNFNQYMASHHRTAGTWLSVYPLKEELKNWQSKGPVFVDVGGGIGQQCVELLAQHPDLSDRVILQDLPHCIQEAPERPGVAKMIYDIYDPQPIKGFSPVGAVVGPLSAYKTAGAKFYYMRAVLHILPDDKCRVVLGNMVGAMSRESILLIDEMVIPDTGVQWQAAQFDLTMMCAHAATERTWTQYQELLDSSNLGIRDTYVYHPSWHRSILAVVLK